MSYVLSALFLFAEIQLSLCPADLKKSLTRLEIADAEIKERTTYFFDAGDGVFHQHGVAIRLRVTQNSAKLNVKVRNVSVMDIPEEVQRADGFKCEHDVHPFRDTPSCSLNQELPLTDAVALIGDPELLGHLLSPDQLRLLAVKGTPPFKADKMKALGPILQKIVKWDHFLKGHEASLELSRVGSSYRRMEFSTRYPASERHQAAAEVKRFLQKKGVGLCDMPQLSPIEVLLGASS